MSRAGIMLILLLGTLTALRPAEKFDPFAADQMLLAIARCPAPEQFNLRCQKFLKTLNPFYAGREPFLSSLESRLHNPRLRNMRKNEWVEAVLFAQPLENARHWAYVFNVTDERQYVADLLAGGNIRQEAQEKSITRYRRTGNNEGEVFYLVFVNGAGRKIAIVGDNFVTVDRTRALYLPHLAEGLLDNSADLGLIFHGTRFYLADAQFLPRFFNILQQDLAVELAGVTAKPDNAMVVFLTRVLEQCQRLVKELAIIRGGVNLQENNLRLAGTATLRYGGSVQYALSGVKAPVPELCAALPEGSEIIAQTGVWQEIMGQLLEILGDAGLQTLPEASRGDVVAATKKWYSPLVTANLQATAWGIVPGKGRLSGPLAVSLLKWEKPEMLPEIWEMLTGYLNDSAAAQALSERGIKWEIVTDPVAERVGAQATVKRTQITCNAQNFTMPGILAGTNRFLTALYRDTLVIVAPTAPLEFDQYRVAEPYMLQILAETLSRLESRLEKKNPPLEEKSSARRELRVVPQGNTFFRVAGHPLRLTQMALQGETVWPQPGEADRLPVPWGTFAEELRNFSAVKNPVCGELRAPRNQLQFTLDFPVATLAECAAAFLDCRPAEKNAGNANRRTDSEKRENTNHTKKN